MARFDQAAVIFRLECLVTQGRPSRRQTRSVCLDLGPALIFILGFHHADLRDGAGVDKRIHRASLQKLMASFELKGSPEIGVEPTGLPFNSKLAIELLKARSVNPLVNAGAIAQVSMVKAKNEDERWAKVQGNLSAFAGVKELPLSDETFKSEYDSAWSNRAIANLLYNYERLYSDPEEALRVYTKQCSVLVTTKELGLMGATLSNGGVNPKTGKRLLNEEHVPELLSVMLTAGFYDESGMWSYTAGLPSKTGVGGGIVSVVPGEMAIAAFSPRLDEAGNSVRAQKAIDYIADQLQLSIFDGR